MSVRKLEDRINFNDFSTKPLKSTTYADMRGVVDFGNLFQFAPYESGYCFLAVINGPYLAGDSSYKDKEKNGVKMMDYFRELQEAFIKILEQEFRGLSGIDNISAETMDITDGITTMSLLGKVNQSSNSTLSMTFTEKAGTVITKYISTYLRWIRDPKTQAKTYGGCITGSNSYTVSAVKEVFNMLYVITDSTCLNIEKAFLILNAQPTEAPFGDVYATEKGNIGTVDVSINWNAFVVDGRLVNKIAFVYMRTLINTADNATGKINLDSYEMDWSISGVNGNVMNTTDLVLNKDGTFGAIATYNSSGQLDTATIDSKTQLLIQHAKPDNIGGKNWQEYAGIGAIKSTS